MTGDRNPFVDNCRAVLFTHRFFAAISACCIFFCFIGCGGSQKSRFYTLAQLARTPTVDLDAESVGISIGVGPVRLPEYLNRPQIVTRTNTYELEISEFDRWGASLEAAITGVLAENLSVLLSSDSVFPYPWKSRNAPDCQVVIDIIRFDGDIPGNVELKTRWTLVKGGQETGMTRQTFYSRMPIAGQGYTGMASTMSLILYELSREIANAVLSGQSAATRKTP